MLGTLADDVGGLITGLPDPLCRPAVPNKEIPQRELELRITERVDPVERESQDRDERGLSPPQPNPPYLPPGGSQQGRHCHGDRERPPAHDRAPQSRGRLAQHGGHGQGDEGRCYLFAAAAWRAQPHPDATHHRLGDADTDGVEAGLFVSAPLSLLLPNPKTCPHSQTKATIPAMVQPPSFFPRGRGFLRMWRRTS
ncbi:hypothetical protein [Streptomyces sp. SGAir0957]